MKKSISVIILSLGLFSLANEVKAARELTQLELEAPEVFVKVTNEDLANFEALLENLVNSSVTSLDLGETQIVNDQLNAILQLIGARLNVLRIDSCFNLTNFIPVRDHCPKLLSLDLGNTEITGEQLGKQLDVILAQIGGRLRLLNLNFCPLNNVISTAIATHYRNLQALYLHTTFITDEQLNIILSAIEGSLIILDLHECESLTNFAPIATYCPNLQVLDLSGTNITDEQLVEILGAIGRNLRELDLIDCCNLEENLVDLFKKAYEHIAISF